MALKKSKTLYNQKVYKVFIPRISMVYADKNKQKFMTRCYQKALGILKKFHEEEFKKILKKLLKMEVKDGKDRCNKNN